MMGPSGIAPNVLAKRLEREFPQDFKNMVEDLKMKDEDTWEKLNKAPSSQSTFQQELYAMEKKKSMLITMLS